MQDNEELQDQLAKLFFKIQLLEKRRKETKKISFIFSLAILGIVFIFSIYAFQITRNIETKKIIQKTLQTGLIQRKARQKIQKTLDTAVPVLLGEFNKQFLLDPGFFQQIKKEWKTFLQVAEEDISSALPVLYSELVKSQKEAILTTFPEFRNEKEVINAMDHLIEIGSPRVYNAFVSYFDAHKNSLITIYDAVSQLNDPALQNRPDLERAVLGITLEIFGKFLLKEFEKGGSANE